LDDKQFEEQLAVFDIEIEGWKKALESTFWITGGQIQQQCQCHISRFYDAMS
jgi:hypothetical protein